MLSLQRRVVAAGVSVGMAFTGLAASAPAEVTPVVAHGAMTKGASRTTGNRLAARRKALEAAAAEAAANAVAAANAAAGAAGAEAAAISDGFRLKMRNMHTGESLDIVYRVGDMYLPEAIERLNYFLRDHNTQEVVDYDPKEFDVLHGVLERLRRPNGVIDVVCGYRTPETNAALRHGSPRTGVAEHSQHMEGHAIDIRVPGVSTVALRNAALSLHAGGVGYYPVSQFVHVDVGPVRTWAFGAAKPKVHRSRAGHVSAGM
jgi:uncharacterized protein YcbK (DUF882 family)